MTLAYTAKLGLKHRPTNIGTQKIESSALKTYGMASASFSLQDILKMIKFFEKTFLLANTSIEIVLGMLFFSLRKTDFEFEIREFIWRSYIVAEALSTISRVKLIDKREFAKTALNEKLETFVIYLAALEVDLLIHPSQVAQIAALQ